MALLVRLKNLRKKKPGNSSRVNLFGVMNLTREFIGFFRNQGHGMIINTSSVAGRIHYSALQPVQLEQMGFRRFFRIPSI